MINPFKTNSAFYEPFLTDTVIYSKGGECFPVRAMVSDAGIDEVFSDQGVSTSRKLIDVTLLKRNNGLIDGREGADGDFPCWPCDDIEPQISDVIEVGGVRFGVVDVSRFDTEVYNIRGRSI